MNLRYNIKLQMNQSSMNHSTNAGRAKKFSHCSGKIIHFSTFFIKNKRCYIIQNDNWQVYVGYLGDNFQLICKLIIKHKILCQTYSLQQNTLYAGTNKGTIAIIKLQEQKLIINQNDKQVVKQEQKQVQISIVNGQPIIGLISYENKKYEANEIIVIQSNGIISRYVNKKYYKQIKLPFKILKVFTNKNITSSCSSPKDCLNCSNSKDLSSTKDCSKDLSNTKDCSNCLNNDIAVVIVKQKGKYPYLFSIFHIISMINSNQSNQQQHILSIFKDYDQVQNLYPDQQVISEKIIQISISTTKSAIGIIENKKNLTVYRVQLDKKSSHFVIEPLFRVSQQEQMSKLDFLDQNILYVCPNKGLSTINIEKRTKVGKGLSFKGSATYEIGCWVDVPNRVVLIGTIEGPKSKITLHELSSKE